MIELPINDVVHFDSEAEFAAAYEIACRRGFNVGDDPSRETVVARYFSDSLANARAAILRDHEERQACELVVEYSDGVEIKERHVNGAAAREALEQYAARADDGELDDFDFVDEPLDEPRNATNAAPPRPTRGRIVGCFGSSLGGFC